MFTLFAVFKVSCDNFVRIVIMLETDICRLCLTKDNLVWIFDKRFESSENMKDVIYITTGVEIHIKDVISQKICKKCCQVTIKMFEFRRTSLRNDKHLREECKNYLKDNNVRIPNTEVTIKSESKRKIEEVKIEPKMESKPVFKIHPSVRDLFRVYPQIKLPTVCLSSHITPFVSMPMDDVENYFKVRKLDFKLHTKLALKPCSKVATKKTSMAAKPTTLNSPTTTNNCTITKIVPSKSENKDNTTRPINEKLLANNSVTKTSDKVRNTKDADIVSTQSKAKSTINIISNNIVKVNDVKSSKNNDIINLAKPKTIKNYEIFDLFKPKSSKDITPDKTPVKKKRKLSETEETSTKESSSKKPNVMESLGLMAKPSAPSSTSFTDSPSLSYVANTSVPLHICDVCNSVQYCAKDLRKHQLKHLRCQFCKLKFRTLETKNKHIDTKCIIKNTMYNLPDVQLAKIEYDLEVRKKYPTTFIDFPPLKNMRDVTDNTLNMKDIEVTTGKDTNPLGPDTETQKLEVPRKPNITEDAVEIIEILSDDEDPPLPKVKMTFAPDEIITKALLGHGISKPDSNVRPPVPTTVTPKSSSKTSKAPILNTSDSKPESVVYNTVSIVKPDIKIKNSNVLESIDPKFTDVKILKELLTKFEPLQLCVEKIVQTEMPSNQSICVNRTDLTSELKNLKQQLHVYKIPVVIKSGTFNVTYNYHADERPPKKLSLWNDLTPIDIKTNLRVLSPPNNERQVISEKTNLQETNNSSCPSSPATNIFDVRRQTTAIPPRFICINKNPINSTFTSYDSSTTSIIDMNPLLNKFLQPESLTSATETVTSAPVSTPVSSTLHVVTSVSSAPHVVTPVSSTHVVTPVSSTSRLVTPVFSTPHVVTSVSSTPHVVKPVSSTPHVVTPVFSTPHVVTPASSTPQVVTPVSSTPHAVAPVFSTPHAVTPVFSTPHAVTPVFSAPHAVTPVFSTTHTVTPASSTPHVVTPVSSTPHVVTPVFSSQAGTPVSSTPHVVTPVFSSHGGTPVSSTPYVVTPVSSTPHVVTPVFSSHAGTPVSSTPYVGTPVSSTPHVVTPVFSSHAGTPVFSSHAGTPVSSTPYVVTPASSTPYVGTPVSSTPPIEPPVSSIPHTEKPFSNTTVPLGIIRVKNVWELT